MTEVDMAWAIFDRDFGWDRPKSPVSFWTKASGEPQSFPRDVIDAAIAAGAARAFETPKADAAPVIKGRRRGR